MAADSIQITSKSRVVVFSGNLMKAPPLDRRGRKKWHERYFILRANKTLECYKSRKAAEASKKSPRRVIDLRECINLEIGLEYKNLQHILSLGTFKRTFFFGAPSDALMLQWANVLEKVKNAQEGESIELLDIGLRKSKDHKAVHRVKPSVSLHQFTVKSIYSAGGSKSTVALAHFTRDSADTINLRESQTSGVDFAPIPPKRTSSLGSRSSTGSKEEEATSRLENEIETHSPHVAKPRVVAVTMRSNVRPPSDTSVREYALRESSASISSQQSTASSRVVYIPSRVPPPMLTARKFGPHAAKTPERAKPQDQVDFGSAAPLKRKPKEHAKEFVPREGALRRGRVVRGTSPQPKTKGSDGLREQVLQTGRTKPGSSTNLGDGSSAILHSNMKRSFRYRKITLRPEKPIFGNAQDGDNSSDEETDTEGSSGIFISDEHVKKAGPNFGMNPSPPVVRKFEPDSSKRPRVLCRVRPNSYSRVTVGSVREALTDIGSRNCSASGLRQNKMLAQTVGQSSSDSTGESQGDLSEVPTDSPLTPDVFDLPTFQSDSFLYRSTNSLNSLDNILVEPPSMFGEEREGAGRDNREKEGPNSTSSNQNGNETELRGPPASSNLESDPLTNATLLIDRNSTESNDTGYTSGASPSYQEQQKLSMEFEETCAQNEDSSEDQSSTPPQANSQYQSQNSVASSDSVRSYVPLVFHSPRVCGNTSVFAIQVCLVENSDELIKDLIALKSLEGYGLVECEEEEQQGSNVAAVGDDFTVETALEDLEFGFSIVSSTQKDLFMRKVRQFQFEIKDLFGCSKKPFSCDVEIRHADQLTLLPIEVQRV